MKKSAGLLPLVFYGWPSWPWFLIWYSESRKDPAPWRICHMWN
jgi:hypothetical protein